MVTFAVIPAVAGGLLIVLGGARLIQDEVFSHMQSIADAACSELQLVCLDELSDLGRFTQRERFRQAAAVLADPSSTATRLKVQRDTMARQLEQLVSPTEYLGGAAVLVSLRNGRALAWHGCSASHAREIIAHHAPTSGLAAPAAWLSPAHLDTVTGQPVMAVIQALTPPEGRTSPPVAAIICHVPLSYRIYPSIEERASIGRTGEIVFVDSEGRALRDVRYWPKSAFRKVVVAVPAQAAVAGQRGIKVARDYRGVLVVAAVDHVPAGGSWPRWTPPRPTPQWPGWG
jgi:hypothetical protein